MGLTRISATSVTDTDFKTSCKVATLTNITSFTATPNTVDGYTFSVGDRVLVKEQSNPAENGIYVVESVGTGSNGRWSRAGDFRDTKGITNGAITFVERGTEANTFFFLGGLTSSVVVGTTALTFNSLVTETASTVIGSSQPNITSVGTLTSLAVTGNANVGNILAGGYFYSNGSPLTVDSTQIVNGNSNVVVAANSNISVSVSGNSNVIVVTGTGANINGYANITGNTNLTNLSASFANINNRSSGSILSITGVPFLPLGDQVWSFRTGTGLGQPGSWISFPDSSNQYTAYPGTATTLTLGSNITGGNLSTGGILSVTGNANVGNLNTTGDIQIGGNDIRSSTGNIAITLNDKDVTVIGNLAVQGKTTTIGSENYTVTDSIIDLHTFANLAPLDADDGRDIGIRFHYYKVSDKHAFLGWDNSTGFLEYYSDATETSGTISGTLGTLKVANVFANSGVFYNGTSNITVNASGNVNVSVAGNANILTVTGTGANISGTANITGNANVGNLGTAQVLASANITSPQLISNVASGTAPLVVTSTTRVANLNVANAGYADTAGSATSATSATTAGTVTTAAQPNITSVGTLSSLNVTGNANTGNLGTAQVLASANVTAPQLISNVATGTAPLVVSSTTQVANLNAATAGTVITAAQPNITSLGTLSALTVTGNANVGNILAGGFYYSNGSPFTVDSTQIVNGNSNVRVAANSNVTVSVAGNANVFTVTGTGANISGTANVTGNASVGNILAGNFYFSNGTPFTRYTASSSAPTSPLNGDLWYDTADVVLYVRIGDGVSSSWLDISSSTNIFADITANTANITSTLTVGANANVANLTANGTVNLGAIGNVKITGGSANYVLKTDGSGNLSFAAPAGANFAVSATAPSSPAVGDYWYDTDTDILYLRINDGTSSLWLDISTDLTARLVASATTPSSAALGDWWYDTSTDILFQYINDGTSNVWVDVTSTGNTFSSITATTANIGNINLTGNLANGNSNVRVAANSNITVSAAGNANILTVTGTGVNIAGTANISSTLNVTGNTTLGNLTATALTATNLTVGGTFTLTGNLTVGNVSTASVFNGNSNVQIPSGGNISVSAAGTANVLVVQSSGVVVSGSILPSADAIYNLGSTTNKWSTVYGLATSAQYADLAEKYHADNSYDPGTVVIFGGSAEITVTNVSHDTRIAGVISTAPAYLMNDNNQDATWLPVALTGRVPCRVQGPVAKGDLLVASQLEGVAEKLDKSKYEPGCVIGKSLENHPDNTVKTIEVVVGRF